MADYSIYASDAMHPYQSSQSFSKPATRSGWNTLAEGSRFLSIAASSLYAACRVAECLVPSGHLIKDGAHRLGSAASLVGRLAQATSAGASVYVDSVEDENQLSSGTLKPRRLSERSRARWAMAKAAGNFALSTTLTRLGDWVGGYDL